MAKFHDRRWLAYTPEQLFAVAADVEQYPAFLPWVSAVRVIERMPDVMIVDLLVGFKGLNEKYRSRVEMSPSRDLRISHIQGPMKHLICNWRFEASQIDGCEVRFDVDFTFKSNVLNMLANQMLDRAVRKMVDAFEQRAKRLYDPNGDASGINSSSAHNAA